jgi:hypothetical protein
MQLLLRHSKLASTVRYINIEVEDALDLAEQTDVCGNRPSGRAGPGGSAAGMRPRSGSLKA